MKPRNLLELLGLRRKAQHYDYVVRDYPLEDGKVIHFAEWQHPSQSSAVAPAAFSAKTIDGYRQLLDEGDFCIDIGAHTGDTTIPMGVAAGTSGCVLGLEPNPYVYHVLEKNARANSHLCNVRTMLAAAGPEQGFLEFEYSDSGFCNGGRHEGISALRHGHAYKLEVFCVDLATELQQHFTSEMPRLKFIKVDAEGFDLYILRSLGGIIDTYRPVIKTEVFKKTDRQYRETLLSFFTAHNYVVHEIIEEPLKPGPIVTMDNAMKPDTYDIICLSDKSDLEFVTAWRPE